MKYAHGRVVSAGRRPRRCDARRIRRARVPAAGFLTANFGFFTSRLLRFCPLAIVCFLPLAAISASVLLAAPGQVQGCRPGVTVWSEHQGVVTFSKWPLPRM